MVVCSSTELFMSEVEKLRKLFWNNGYSNSFFEKVFQCYENKNLKDRNSDIDSDRRYFEKIPYIGPSFK